MAQTPRLDRSFDPQHGRPVAVAPGVRRVTARNRSAFTFQGTNSYIVGTDVLAVIDPGPADEAHLQALIDAIGGRPVSHIVVTHTHMDHSALAPALAERTGARIAGAAPHHAARDLHIGEINPLDAAADKAYRPDRALAHDETIGGPDWTLRAIATPGHAANHLCFALDGTGIVFSGDHVMAWATPIVAPPDGAMGDYMASLDVMLARDDSLYLPGHGGPVREPSAFVRGLKTHRKLRERAIIERLRGGDDAIPAIVAAIYRDTDPRLHGAAALSVLAHLEDLIARGLVRTDGPPAIDGRFRPA